MRAPLLITHAIVVVVITDSVTISNSTIIIIRNSTMIITVTLVPPIVGDECVIEEREGDGAIRRGVQFVDGLLEYRV